MNKQSDAKKSIESFIRIMNKFNSIEKKPKKYGTGHLLYPSEIHTIEAIGNNKGINVTSLAQIMGVTKGASSQVVDKLTKKKIVEKQAVVSAKNEVSLDLTEIGLMIYNSHEQYHKEFYKEIEEQLNTLTVEQSKSFLKILDSLENSLDKRNSE